jgi:hypothetical protein
MYRQIHSSALGKVDLVEQAVVSIPVRYFAARGIKFEQECDDLDYYESAFFIIDERTPFALIHYRGNPENSTAIYLERSLKGNTLRDTLASILKIFDLPKSSITWMYSGQ